MHTHAHTCAHTHHLSKQKLRHDGTYPNTEHVSGRGKQVHNSKSSLPTKQSKAILSHFGGSTDGGKARRTLSLSDLTYYVLPNLFRLKRLASSSFGYLFLVTRVPQPEGNITLRHKGPGSRQKGPFPPLVPTRIPLIAQHFSDGASVPSQETAQPQKELGSSVSCSLVAGLDREPLCSSSQRESLAPESGGRSLTCLVKTSIHPPPTHTSARHSKGKPRLCPSCR